MVSTLIQDAKKWRMELILFNLGGHASFEETVELLQPGRNLEVRAPFVKVDKAGIYYLRNDAP